MYNRAGMSRLFIGARKHILPAILVFTLAACGEAEPIVTEITTVVESPIPTNTITPIPATPTPTPIPMAALVNGEGITLEEFEAELSRFRSAGDNWITQTEQEVELLVLDDLINQMILAQGAIENGFILEEVEVQTRISELITNAGGESEFDNWLLENYYTQKTFSKALERSILGAWMRDQILAEVPLSGEQVHARQIFLLSQDQANQVLAELESGKEFATLLEIYDPVTRGELGWFPRDFLPHQSIEDAAFNLEPGQYSQVIETSIGYHIIQVIERDPERRLSPEARLAWREKALQDWITIQQEKSDIVILIPLKGE